ncbi:MAG: transposase [Actinomycetia bacterium]|nr:transposase [Actinomycetes bacterium]
MARSDSVAALDMSGPYRLVFNTMLPDATQVADFMW